MKTIKAIIGGAFGDEGKGLFTDYLASQSERKTCVVRFNGGAQAGHTVKTPDGRRHVFSHFGSGGFLGLPTFLSSFFVCNPIVFLRERDQLLTCGVVPEVFVDENCPITTPYDIMINQIVEQSRGSKRHGSVGVGFGETLERETNAKYVLRLCELKNTDGLRTRLNAIRSDWVYTRLTRLGVKVIGDEWIKRFDSDSIREKFIEDVGHFLEHITPVKSAYLNKWDHFIFEGAQGLLLDQNRGWFPHVTRSNTGISNVLALAEGIAVQDIDVYYLTRSYTTRHGAGPLPHELPHLPYTGIIDKTNQPNPYQGTLRFAWFSVELFRDAVLQDLADGRNQFNLRPHLAMSCLDQIEGNARYIYKDALESSGIDGLLDITRRQIGAQTILASHGPTRATIRSFNPEGVSRRAVANKSDGFFKSFDIVENNVATLEA